MKIFLRAKRAELHAKLKETGNGAVNKLSGCLSDTRGDGTVNVLIGIVIAVVAAGIVIGAITGSLQSIWDALIAKIMSLF